MSITPIEAPLPGERLLGLAPEDATQAARWWLRRPNLFAGRTLTAPTLSGRQAWAAAHLALRARAFTPGVVQGLETALIADAETASGLGDTRLALMQGSALAADGEDLQVPQAHELALTRLPVVADPSAFAGLGAAGGSGDTLAGKLIGPDLGTVIAADPDALPRVGILVLQPVCADRIGEFDPTDPCPLHACGEGTIAFEDWRIGDGARLLWYAWPQEWRSLPPLPPSGPQRWRNLLAWRIFDAERTLGADEGLPWEAFGVALGLVACAADWTPFFLDRASVQRTGGRGRWPRMGGGASGLGTHWRLPALWQAQLEQLAEQITAAGDASAATLAAGFTRLPPFGLLPARALDLETLRSDFFPASFELDAAPVPIEQLDAAIGEAASLAAIDLGLGGRVRLLVPVPQAVFDPRLLLRERIDPEFATTLAGFLLERARWLGARQGLRTRAALLARAISGRALAVPDIDADAEALEPESLAPWGPPPAGGGHRSQLAAGIHQHFFEAATETLTVANGSELYAWVYLDPDHPPRTLMLQWHANGWQHRAYWGEDLIPWGAADSSERVRIDELPPAGRWVELRIPAAGVGLGAQVVDGMAFTLYDGQAAYGMTGSIAADGTRQKWFCGVLPANARGGGDEPWTMLTHNDLWAPFERIDEVLPVDGDGAPDGGGHATASAIGVSEHGFDGARTTMRAAASERLYVWVYLDPNVPPTQVLVEWRSSTRLHQAWWGLERLPAVPQPGLVRLRAGPLPRPGRWVRLEVGADEASGVGAADREIHGIRFLVAGGSVSFGASGVIDSSGNERPWFAGSLPSGARPSGTWHFLSPRDLQAPGSAARNGAVAASLALYDDPALAALSAHERYQLFERGLEGFIAYLKARADRADDLVDFNFVKVQTDIYRVRQIILGSSAATRLAVSPALAGIAQAETAVATTERIAGFFNELKQEETPQRTASQAQPSTAASTGGATPAVNTDNTLALVRNLDLGRLELDTGRGTISDTGTRGTDLKGTSNLFIKSATAPQFTLGGARDFLPSDITNAAPLIGKAEVRTVSIAERLQAPRATEAKDYTTSTRYEAVRAIAAYAAELTREDGGETPGLFLDIEFHGTRGDPALFYLNQGEAQKAPIPAIDTDNAEERALLEARPRSLPFTQLLLESWRMPLLLKTPWRLRVDEATQFADGTDLADNTVVLMRQLEGQVKRYRDAIARSQQVLDGLRISARALDSRLRAIGEELAEARHDVAVTRALIAEEEARLAAINARRAGILRDHVHFIAYQRPRETELIATAPQRTLDPGLLAPAVPACLAAHQDAPDALRELLAVVREAPARWFAAVPALLDRLDRSDLLLKAMQSAQLRSQLLDFKLAAQSAPAAAATGVAGAIASLQDKRLLAVQQLRSAATRIDLAVVASLGWKGARAEAEKVVTLGDLIDGEHGNGAVASRAAAVFDELSRIAACLHEAFSAVLPSIRLDWAERLSQFDATPRLRNLAGLARWGEIDYTDRHRLQAHVDWLFGQMRSGDADAEQLMNDVVHMSLLLASHAPVNRILSGRIPEPVTLRPGIRLPIRVIDALQLRVGMQALIYQGERVVARANVEDLSGTTAAATVVQVEGATLNLAADTRVHFVDAASPVAMGAVRLAGTKAV